MTSSPNATPRPRWALPALAAIATFAGITYAWGIGHISLEIYYQAAVRSMGSSWHDFFYGAFDPRGTISVDKLPGSLWIQALSVRLFGYHPWAIVLPQVVEGIATVLFLYKTVNKVAGPVGAITAAAVIAVTPATVALDRGNISDSLLILLLVLAADATTNALTHATSKGRTAWLLVAGLWVGLAFQAKMLQAWLVLPTLGLAWLIAAPTANIARRIGQFAAATAVAVLVSLSWMSVVSLVPQHDRPYVDGSTHDSLFQQVFEYNGFSRVGQSEPGSANSLAAFSSLTDFRLPNQPGPGRLLSGAGGRDIGWLLPTSIVAAAAILWRRRRRPRTDLLRAAAVLWGTWLLIDAVAFSVLTGINAYYLAALTPAAAALCGIAVAEVWRPAPTSGSAADQHAALADEHPTDAVAHAHDRAPSFVVLAVVVATIAYGLWLLWPAPVALRMAMLVLALALVGTGKWLLLFRHRPVGYALVVAAVVVFPLAASLDIVSDGLGPFDTPYQSAAVTHITQVEPREVLTTLGSALKLLEEANRNDRFIAATYTSIVAAPLIVGSGQEFEPIGGFTGANPYPTLGQIQRQVRERQLSTIITLKVDDPRIRWIERHCNSVPVVNKKQPRGLPQPEVYFCPPKRG